MRDLNNFRLINKIEKSIINNSLQKFSTKILLYIRQENYRFYIFFNEQKDAIKFPLIFLVSHEKSIFLEEELKNENVIAASVYLGFIKKGEFHLSLEGAEFFLKRSLIQDRNILKVSNKGEKAILYGNSVVKGMVTDISSDLQKNTLMLVLNESRELLALALSEIDFSKYKILSQGDLVAKNLTDKGIYLRRKQ